MFVDIGLIKCINDGIEQILDVMRRDSVCVLYVCVCTGNNPVPHL